MSTEIDERVVSMKFDNKQFESGTAVTMSTLDRLKKGLNLEGASKGLEGVGAAAKNISMDGLASGVDAIKVKFSALQVIAVGALLNITNSAMNAGKNLISSLTLDPVMDGFKEYETQMGAIQTVLANTSSKGTTLKDVNAALGELNTYSDKTIYNFTEMTKNIGTFTAAGVDLKTSVAAIKGIANLAAVSGSNSEQASTAMYQLSQAMASGTVKLMDWNSVVNAGMGGEIFQKSLQETAKVHGVNIDAMIKKEGSFRETLKTGWLTTSVLTETLSKFTGDLSAQQLKALGYSDKQVVSIMKMGQTAYEAATKVKTFSQLLDTLREAVGSGWAQTWGTIVGDFDEAKMLFTSVSNTLGGIIGASATARNTMLTGWKALGGRTALIDAIRIAFTNVMDVVKAVSSAFREVFPATTSKQLFNITTGLKSFVSSLTMSKSGLENIHNTFKGLFAVLDIGVQIITFIAKALFLVVGAFLPVTDGVYAVTGGFGYFLAMIDNAIKKSNIFGIALTGIGAVMGVVRKIITTAISVIALGFNTVADVIRPVIEQFKNFVKTSTLIADVTDKVKSVFINIGNALIPYIEQLKTFVRTSTLIEDITNSVKDAFTAAWMALLPYIEAVNHFIQTSTLFEDVVNSIKDALGPYIDKFKTFVQTSTLFEDVLGTIKMLFMDLGGGIKNLIASIQKLNFNEATGASDKLSTAFVFLSNTGDKVKESFSGAGNKIEGFKNVLEEIGGAIKRTFGPAITFLIDKIKGLTLSDLGIALAGGGIFMLAKSFTKAIGSVKSVTDGFSEIIEGVTGSLEAFQKKLKAESILKIAIAIGILALSVVALSLIPTEALYKALSALTVICLELSLGMMVLDKASSASPGLPTKLIALGVAIMFIAEAVKKLSEIDNEKMKTGVQGLAAILTTLAIFIKFTSSAAGIQTSIIGVVGIALAVLILCDAVKKFGAIDPKVMDAGIQGIVSALLVLGVFIKVIGNPEHMIAVGVGMTLMSVALTLFAGAIGLYAIIPIPVLAKGMIAIGVALGILALAARAMSDPGVLAGAAALLVLAIAVNVLVPAMVILGLLPIKVIGVALLALAGIFVVLGLAGLVLAPLAPIIFTLAAAIGLIGVGAFLLGGGLILFSAGLAALTVSLGAFIAGLIAGFVVLLKTIPMIAKLIGTAVIAIATEIEAAIPAIQGAVIAIATGIVAVIDALIDPVVKAAVKLLLVLLVELAKYILPMVDAGMKLVIGFMNGITNNMPQLVLAAAKFMLAFLNSINGQIPKLIDAAVTIVITFVDSVAAQLPRIIESALNFILAFVNGLADAIRNNTPAITSACLNLITAIVDALNSMSDMLLDVGINIVKGILSGMDSMMAALFASVADLGAGMLKSIKDFLGIHSPSTAFAEIGQFICQGLINGILNLSATVVRTVWNMANGALNAVGSFIGSFVSSGVNIITGLIRGIWSLVGSVSGTVWNIVSGAANTVGSFIGTFVSWGINIITGLIRGISSMAGSVAQTGRNVVQGIINGVGGMIGGFTDFGRNVVQGMINGITSMAGELKKKALSVFSGLPDGVKKMLGIASPSKVFKKIGGYTGEGFVIGLTSYASKVSDSAKNLGQGAVNAMSKAISGVSDIVNMGIDPNPTITPVMDLSNIQNGSKQLYSMMNGIDGSVISGSVNLANNTSRSIQASTNSIVDSKTSQSSNDAPIAGVGNNNVFNIKSTDPKQVAVEVANILQKKVERSDATWA